MNNRIILTDLNLQNFATFENQQIGFIESFNAIVGETGSGKSLILDALQLILGARADKGLIRKGSTFATIEATFCSSDPNIFTYFDDIGYPCAGSEIIIKRVIYNNGRTRSFLNHQSCPLSTLTTFSRDFIDLVGQFENQKLLSEDYQLCLLDSYASIGDMTKQYHMLFSSYQDLRNNLVKLKERKDQRSQREDFIAFQLEEITGLSPTIEDEEDLIREKDTLIAREQKRDILSSTLMTLSNNEQSNLLSSLHSVIVQLERDSEIVSASDITRLHSAHQLLEEVSYNLSKDIDDELNGSRLEEIINRLDLYQKLKRKFGGSTENLIQAQKDLQIEALELKTLDDEIAKLEHSISQIYSELDEKAKILHHARQKKAEELSGKLTQGVQSLMMKGATIILQVIRKDILDANGFTSLNFVAETNPGEGYHLVKKAASGGELSRILLTLRQVVASNESISVFLFDEIDAGIGGETAVCTGKALRNVSLNSQVIAITHLPQIAHHADKLINVTKVINDSNLEQKRTISAISEYTGGGKDKYITKMTQLN